MITWERLTPGSVDANQIGKQNLINTFMVDSTESNDDN